MKIRAISSAEARTVRHPVLRPGLPPEAAVLDHDDDPATRHFGAFAGERLVAVATFFPEPCPKRPGARAWRLRGMATLEDMRGRGAGTALAVEGVHAASAAGAALMWCNARVSARGFYEKLGFAVVGDRFDLPVAGPHYVMVKTLETPS